MKAKIIWLYYYIDSWIRRICTRLHIKLKYKREFPGKLYIGAETANKFISNLILDGKPAMVARIGGSETIAAAQEAGISLGMLPHFTKGCMRNITQCSGLFPAQESTIRRFGQLQLAILQDLDLLAEWKTPLQKYLINEYCPNNILVTNLRALEPFFFKNAWTRSLKGKRVVVIHPFKDTIEKQYRNRQHLFRDPDFLPEFELRVVKAVQTIAGEKDPRFQDWFEALEYMVEETLKEDFDVAIIGCGAYGMALASRIKQAGKVAIHMGGATQLLFGIKGSRWDTYPDIPKLYNDYWVRPAETERPKNAQVVEGGCYW